MSKLFRIGSSALRRAGAIVAACVLLVSIQRGRSAELHVLRGHVPAVVSKLTPLGELPGDQVLKLAVGLELRDPAGLDDLVRQLYETGNPGFHEWLTPTELADKFCAREQEIRAVSDWAKAHGLELTFEHSNRLVLDLEGTVATVEAALHVKLHVYKHPKEGRTFFALDTEPSVDVAGVETISGLDDYSRPRPMHVIKPLESKGAMEPRAGSGPGGAYRGSDFRAAYVPGTSLDGTGQTVGLLQFDGFYAGDITAYESQSGLPNVPITVVPIDGGVSIPGGGNSEVCLDIEMVMAMAPNISRIYVYEAPNPSPWVDLLSRMQTDNFSKQLSCSWGGGSPNATAENIFKLMAAQGQSFFNATGDSDAFTGSIPFPSDSTNITQVGGTTLTTTGPGGAYVSEQVWNWGLVQGSYVGSSGGISTYYKIPSYQIPVVMSKNQGSTTMRNVPDVALTGDNVYVTYNSGSSGAFGGTSCAAPLWAGLMALVNQQASANGVGPVGFLNPPVYNIGLGPNYTNNFYDITVGDNTWPSSSTKFYATNGFDLCVGWGTPKLALINTLAGHAAPSLQSNSIALLVESCGNGGVDPGETVTMSFGLKNTGAASTTNLVGTLQAGNGISSVGGSQTYGALAPGATASRSFTFTAGGLCGGTVTIALQLQDGAANLGTVLFVIPLGVATAATPLVQNFDSVATPVLPVGWSNNLVNGSQANWVTTTATAHSAPNAAFIADSANAGENALVSPVFFVGSSSAQLTFRQNYNLETRVPKHGASTYYDGGVLEIKIGAGAFADILSAGGSFSTGGYNVTLATGNPLAGRQAWGGNSSGFVTSTVTLPADAAGQNVQLRWACAVDTDNANGGVGWYVDSISLSDIVTACCSANVLPPMTSQPTNKTVLRGSNAAFLVSATGTAPLSYQWSFKGTNLAGATSNALLLLNVQLANAGNYAAIVTNSAGSITSTPALLRVLDWPQLGSITRSGSLGSISFPSVSGLNYTLEYKDSLEEVDWRPIQPSLAGTGGLLVLQDTNAISQTRFYRVRCD
jgi:hypothetical protein